jgi:hypothetical protein
LELFESKDACIAQVYEIMNGLSSAVSLKLNKRISFGPIAGKVISEYNNGKYKINLSIRYHFSSKMNIVLREVFCVTFISFIMSVITHTNLQYLLEDQEGRFFEDLCSLAALFGKTLVTLIMTFINCHVMNSGEVLHQLFSLN